MANRTSHGTLVQTFRYCTASLGSTCRLVYSRPTSCHFTLGRHRLFLLTNIILLLTTSVCTRNRILPGPAMADNNAIAPGRWASRSDARALLSSVQLSYTQSSHRLFGYECLHDPSAACYGTRRKIRRAKDHVYTAHGIITCLQCDTFDQYASRADLYAHRLRAHNHLSCQLCVVSGDYNSQLALSAHQLQAHASFTCHLCTASGHYTTQNDLDDHIDTKHLCYVCRYQFAVLGEHASIHCVSCLICSHDFPHTAAFYRHTVKTHRERESTSCSICGLRGGSYDIALHMRIHGKFRCRHCGLWDLDPSHRKRHEDVCGPKSAPR